MKITLPAGLLDGYALCLLSGDGTETALTLDVQEEEVSFVLDFTDAQCPVQVLRLMPVAYSARYLRPASALRRAADQRKGRDRLNGRRSPGRRW